MTVLANLPSGDAGMLTSIVRCRWSSGRSVRLCHWDGQLPSAQLITEQPLNLYIHRFLRVFQAAKARRSLIGSLQKSLICSALHLGFDFRAHQAMKWIIVGQMPGNLKLDKGTCNVLNRLGKTSDNRCVATLRLHESMLERTVRPSPRWRTTF